MAVKPIAEIDITKPGKYFLTGPAGEHSVADDTTLVLNEFISCLGNELFTVEYLVRFFREKKNWSLRDLEKQCGLPYSHISNIENGKMVPEIETLRKLTSALGDDFRRAVEKAKALRIHKSE
ncbi:MAG: helix-turn-helix transcriptional regulator [Bdellovibrionaceae bacterium]|nr:helix-turn-helix transcriptional regulator [Pseudobdellovibrionaceae bacterium]